MVKEAEANKEADTKKKEEADLRNESEQLIFATERSIKDLGDKVSSEDKEKAEKEIKELREALEKNDLEDIKAKKEKLNESAMALGAKVYEEAAKASQAAQGNDANSEESIKKDDNIKEILANHIISPVRFDKAIQLMNEQGIEEFVEVGPGNALSGFVKKENR